MLRYEIATWKVLVAKDVTVEISVKGQHDDKTLSTPEEVAAVGRVLTDIAEMLARARDCEPEPEGVAKP